MKKTKFDPDKPRSAQKLTPCAKTFINRYDQPRKPGAKALVIEVFVTDDRTEPNKAFDSAAEVYTHRIGVVVYTEEEVEYWTQEKSTRKRRHELPARKSDEGTSHAESGGRGR
jgi:hypothetical protein